jgi:uncharacterized protein YwqG
MEAKCQRLMIHHGPRDRDFANWRLLLQLDTDDAAGMKWGDVGTLYFWIK